MLEKNFRPVCPPGMLLRTKQRRATSCTIAAMEVKIVDCRLRAKYRVANREMKYTEVKTIRSPENRCFRWLTGPHKNEKLKHRFIGMTDLKLLQHISILLSQGCMHVCTRTHTIECPEN